MGFLSQILPYDLSARKNGDLKKGLIEFKALQKAVLEALQAWHHGQLEKFDSLVGENACEIRAIWLAILPKMASPHLIRQIETSISTIDALLIPSTIDRLMRSDESLESILTRESLDIPLSPEEMFLIQSYLLSEMKTVKISKDQIASIYRVEAAEPKNFLRFGDVSISFARNLLSRLRRLLATSSVNFIRQNAFLLNDPTSIQMASPVFTVEQNNLPCIPMFWAYKTVLQRAEKENIPLILHVKFLNKNQDCFSVIDEECLFFKATHNGYVACEPIETDLDQPACVIQGIAAKDADGYLLTKEEWTSFMKKTGVVDVILAGAADHRQYPDPELDDFIRHDEELKSYRQFAQRNGFSSDNPSSFFIQHVYGCRAGKIIQKVSDKIVSNHSENIVTLCNMIREMIPLHSNNSCARPNFKARI